MIVDKSVPKKYIIWVLYCNYHHVNLKYFLHSVTGRVSIENDMLK